MFTEQDIQNVIEAYESRGIVTRDDFGNLDSRPLSDEVLDELRRRGYRSAKMTVPGRHMPGAPNRPSISNYDPDQFDPDEADDFLIKYVLHEY